MADEIPKETRLKIYLLKRERRNWDQHKGFVVIATSPEDAIQVAREAAEDDRLREADFEISEVFPDSRRAVLDAFGDPS